MGDNPASELNGPVTHFVWDGAKADANRSNHGVSFDEASSVFSDPLSLTVPDPEHSETEERSITIGMSQRRRLVVVVHTDRGAAIRIISARLSSRAEMRDYEDG
jgi:hypothetical protein